MDDTKTRLIDELAKHKGKTVYLGVKSSFFFVGPCEEAISNIEFVDMLEKSFAAMVSRKTGFTQLNLACLCGGSIADRPVAKVYKRDSGRKGEIVIIIEGREFGMFWTRREYLAGRDVLQKALEMAKGDQIDLIKK